MTTAATVVGHMPLVFATGPGAGARNSIGTVLVSGMIIGTVFTLFVVPSIYVLLARKRVAVIEARHPQRVPQLAAAVSIALGLVLLSTGASAQTVAAPSSERSAVTVRLGLDEAVRRAVENNPDLAIVRLGTEVEAARVGESRGGDAPDFSSTPSRSGNTTPPAYCLL